MTLQPSDRSHLLSLTPASRRGYLFAVKSTFSAFALVIGLGTGASAQQPIDTVDAVDFGIDHLTAFLHLSPDDIGFRSDYTDPDTFRLRLVADLMQRPLGMRDYLQEMAMAHVDGQPEILARIIHSDLRSEYQTGLTPPYRPTADELVQRYNLYFTSAELNQLLNRAATYLDLIFPRSTEAALARLNNRERAFLTRQLVEVVTMSTDEEFLSVDALDSLEKVEEGYIEEFVTFGYRFDKDPLIAAGIDCLEKLLPEIRVLMRQLEMLGHEELLRSSAVITDDLDRTSYLGFQSGWRIGGVGNDYYAGDYRFILDLGGDDIYDFDYDPSDPHGVIVIDLAGDDRYRARSDFTIASGCLSVGLLLDFGGNDQYLGKSFSAGSGYFGFGLLYDADGDDRYDGDTHAQGAASFGLGLLIDESGRDIYNAALYSQGFGFVQGFGGIVDRDGSDSYYAGGKYKDILRYEDRYLSLSQGFGYGLRPWMSGGIGVILDQYGNDTYNADIFAQAASYWWSLGAIVDGYGNDTYTCFQYGQGAATHMTLGMLLDAAGNDVYFGKGLMHGCGHDYSCGWLLDLAGDDTYTAYDLSQGAGSANGVGLLTDVAGNDRYFISNPANTQGYGNPRREFGSIGLFLDLGGRDQYDGSGRDNSFWNSGSKWGAGMDIELTPSDTAAGAAR